MTNLFEKNKEHFLHRTKKRRGAFMVQTNKDSTSCYLYSERVRTDVFILQDISCRS